MPIQILLDVLLAGARPEERVHHRHENQHEERGHHQAEGEGRRHRHEELGLEALLQEQGQKAADRRDAGEHDRAKPQAAGLAKRRPQRVPLAHAEIDEVDEADRVVDDHARQCDEAEHAEQRQRHPHHGMTEDGAGDAEGDGGEDQERLEVRLELHRQEHEHREQGHDEAHAEAAQRLVRLFPLPLPADPDRRIIGGE